MAEAGNDPAHSGDAIGRLPDELLYTILDKLPLHDAVSTGFLSRRWRDLWKYISIVEFDPFWVEWTGKDVFSSLNQFICLHKGQKILTFTVGFKYQPEMSTHVDSWILFAINKHVKYLQLDFNATDIDMERDTADGPCYKILPCVFNCNSLVRLILCFCEVELPMSIQLHSLEVLRLQETELPQDAIYKLTSNAPALQYLLLTDCNSKTDLHIHVAPNQHFRYLQITEYYSPVNHRTKMFVKAPTAFQVEFLGSMARSKYIIEEVSECAEVHFSFQQMFIACGKHRLNVLGNDSRAKKYENILQEILASFHKSDAIRICQWCIQLLSLRELRNIQRLKFNCTRLKIICTFWKWELPGIIYMLKACHKVENLTFLLVPEKEQIKIPKDYLLRHEFHESRFLEIQDLGLELENLRTVKFDQFEYYQTGENEYFDMNKLLNEAPLAKNIVSLLMKHAVNLDTFIFARDQKILKFALRRKKKKEEEEEEPEGSSPLEITFIDDSERRQ